MNEECDGGMRCTDDPWLKDCNTDADCIIGTGASSTDLGPCEVQVKDGCTPECKYNVCGDGMVDNHYDVQ